MLTTPAFIVEHAKLRAAGAMAHELGQDLTSAHFEEKNREYFLQAAGEKLTRIGHVLGFVFSRAKPFSGELAIQKADAAFSDGAKKSIGDIASRAAERDLWKHRAEVAQEQVASLEAEVLSLRKSGRVAA